MQNLLKKIKIMILDLNKKMDILNTKARNQD